MRKCIVGASLALIAVLSAASMTSGALTVLSSVQPGADLPLGMYAINLDLPQSVGYSAGYARYTASAPQGETLHMHGDLYIKYISGSLFLYNDSTGEEALTVKGGKDGERDDFSVNTMARVDAFRFIYSDQYTVNDTEYFTSWSIYDIRTMTSRVLLESPWASWCDAFYGNGNLYKVQYPRYWNSEDGPTTITAINVDTGESSAAININIDFSPYDSAMPIYAISPDGKTLAIYVFSSVNPPAGPGDPFLCKIYACPLEPNAASRTYQFSAPHCYPAYVAFHDNSTIYVYTIPPAEAETWNPKAPGYNHYMYIIDLTKS